MFYFIRKHCFAIILAVVLGVLMILPFIYFQVKLGSDFYGIFPEIVNDTNFYYARIKDVADGHSFLNNAYLFEHKGGLPQQLFLAEYILAQPLKLFGLSINAVYLVYNFLLPTISFLLAYTALYLISRRRSWSLIFSSFLFFGLYLMTFIRPVSPQFNFIFWLTQFIFLWLLMNNANNTKELRMLLVANIINFGLLFYIYPYYWTFYLIFLAIFTTLNFANSKYFHNSNYGSKQIIKVIVGGLILAIPYFYLNFLSAKLPYYTETLTRLGMIYSHFPSGFRIILWSALGFVVFGWFLWQKVINLDAKAIFFISGILASIIAVNQHLITGKNFEFSSHYDMAAMFFLIFSAVHLFSFVSRKRIMTVTIILAIFIVVFGGLRGYSNQVFAISKEGIYIQNYAPIFGWLNKNTEKDSVVYANNSLSGLIPVYTANNVFYHRNANSFFISDKEVLDRFILNNFFEDFDKSFIIELARSVYGNRYVDAYGHAVQGNKLRRILGMKLEPEIYLPDEAALKVIRRAGELQNGDFAKEIRKYHVDYLIWDENKNPNWQINPKYFQPAIKNNGITIYTANFD